MRIPILYCILALLACKNQSTKKEIEETQILVSSFLKDTSNKILLNKCDSLLIKYFKDDSSNRTVLNGLRITRAYKRDYNFLLFRVYPKLFYDTLIYLKHYESSKIYKYLKDSIKYREELMLTKSILEATDFNAIENYSKLITYMDVILRLHGIKAAENFIHTKISNEQLFGGVYDLNELLIVLERHLEKETNE